MKNSLSLLLGSAAVCAALLLCSTAYSQSTEPGGTAETSRIADIPRIISYQGLVRNLDGKPISDGNHKFFVTLYSDESGTKIVWTDAYSVSTEQGVFSVLLGSGQRALPAGAELNQPLWVGVKLDGQEEMRPLTPLSSSPFALNVADKSITTSKLEDGSVTADKIGTNYVGGIAINGVPVTNKGETINLVGKGNLSLQFDEATNSITMNSLANPLVAGNNNVEAMSAGAGPGFPKIQAVTNTVGTSNNTFVPQFTGGTDITNSHFLDDGTNLAVSTAATTGGTTVFTVKESTGDVDASGYINTTSTSGFYEIGGTTVLNKYGTANIFVGGLAGNTSMSGSVNTATGYEALHSNTSGVVNTASGAYALHGNTTGSDNTADGETALYSNTTGLYNTATGLGALYNSTTGSSNTAIGNDAQWTSATSGSDIPSYNTSVGAYSLISNTIGTYNTAIGYFADVAAGNLTNATAIGNGAVASASNAIQLGDGSVTLVNTSGNVTTSGGFTATAGGADITGTTSINTTSTDLTLTGIGSASFTHFLGLDGSNHVVWSTVSPGGVTNVTATAPLTSSGGATPDISITAGSNNQFLTTNNSGNVAWQGLNIDATLTGDGLNTPLGIDLSHANTWTGTQTLPTTVAQGNALVNSLNSATTTIGATGITPGSHNTFLVTTNSGAVSFQGLNIDATLKNNGVYTALGLELSNYNTWINEVAIAPVSKIDAPSLVVQQTANGTPSYDIFDVESSGGSPTQYLRVDKYGNTYINTSTGVVHSNGSGKLTSSLVNLTADVTGTLPVANGGTGATSLTAHRVLLGNGASAIATASAMTSGQLLIGQGSSSDPAPYNVSQDVALTNAGVATVQGIQGIVVASTTPTNLQTLVYNSTSGHWEPNTLAGGGGVSSVGATSPLASSGGGSPTISITAGSHNTFLTTNNSGVVGFNSIVTDATLLGNGQGTGLGIALSHANTWTATQTFSPSSTSASGVVIVQPTGGTAKLLDVQTHGPTGTVFSITASGQATFGLNVAGGIPASLALNDGTLYGGTGHTATVAIATQGGNYTYTIPYAGNNANFVMTEAIGTQTVATGDVTVKHNLQIGYGPGGTPVEGHVQAGGTHCTLNSTGCIIIIGGVTQLTGPANDIAGQISFQTSSLVTTPACTPGPGPYVNVQMNQNYGGSETPAVVISPCDAASALAEPYAIYRTGTPDYIEIGLAGTVNIKTIYTFNYNVIAVE